MNDSNCRIAPGKLEGQLIDTHTHCGGMDLSNFYNGRYPSSQDILDLDEKRQNAGVGYQIVFPMPSSLYYDIPKYWKTREFQPSGYSEYPFQLENKYLLSQIKHFYLERMLPFVAFSLQDKVHEQESSIIQLAEKYPIYGLKFHPKVDQKSANRIDYESNFVILAEQLDIPIILHTDMKKGSKAIDVLNLAARHPTVRFCVAHLGGPSAEFYKELDKYQNDNLYIDVSPLCARFHLHGTQCPDLVDLDYENPQMVLEYFMTHYPNRMLWGTDSPWTNYGSLEESHQKTLPKFSYRQEVEVIKASGYQEQMTCNTIRYLFGRK